MRDRELVLLMDGVIRFVDIGRQVGVWPRTIHIGFVIPLKSNADETPRRLYYDTKMQRMVVACSNIETYPQVHIHPNLSEIGMINTLVAVDILRLSQSISLLTIRNEMRTMSLLEKLEDEGLTIFAPNYNINCICGKTEKNFPEFNPLLTFENGNFEVTIKCFH